MTENKYCHYCDSPRNELSNCQNCGAPGTPRTKTRKEFGGPFYFDGLVYFVSRDGVLDQNIVWIVYDRDGVCSRVLISPQLRDEILSKTPEGLEISPDIIWELMQGGALRAVERQVGTKKYRLHLELIDGS